MIKLKFTLLLFIFFSLQIANAQIVIEKPKAISPILLDQSALSGVGLKKIDLKDEPEKDFYQKNLFRGKDISIYVVSTESWTNKIKNFPFDEFVYMLHGEAEVRPDTGKVQQFYSGDYFFAPRGFTGEWEIKAGENLHYELSIIASRRADSLLNWIGRNHQLFPRSKLSGTHIKLNESGYFAESLFFGNELKVTLRAEKPTKKKWNQDTTDLFLQILSGQVTMTDLDNNKHTFYTGDFLVIPNGFKGEWESEGHGIVKYLVVKRTIWTKHVEDE